MASIEIALLAAHAQPSGDLFRSRRVRPQSDKFFEDSFASQNRKRHQQKLHRSTDSSRSSPQHRAKLKPDQNELTKSKKNKAGTALAHSQNRPLARPAPPARARASFVGGGSRSRLQYRRCHQRTE